MGHRSAIATAAVGEDAPLRRLAGLARAAAESLAPADALSIRGISHSENTIYLLTDEARGRRLVLRVHRPGYHSRAAIRAELAWMRALREDAGVRTPAALPWADGDLVNHVASAAVPEGRCCVLFEFLNGEAPAEDDLMASFPDLGALTARMHRHSRAWRPPVGFERFSWTLETTVGETPHWGPWQDGPNLDDARRALLRRLVATIRARLERFGVERDRFGLVHADLRLANLLIHDGETRVIDFDDSGFTWYLYDLATALSFIEDRPDVPALIAAWLEGYRRMAPLSPEEEAEIPTFLMLRRMVVLAWMGSHRETDLAKSLGDAYTDGTAALAESYLTRFG